jgi:hypothetical protein
MNLCYLKMFHLTPSPSSLQVELRWINDNGCCFPFLLSFLVISPSNSPRSKTNSYSLPSPNRAAWRLNMSSFEFRNDVLSILKTIIDQDLDISRLLWNLKWSSSRFSSRASWLRDSLSLTRKSYAFNCVRVRSHESSISYNDISVSGRGITLRITYRCLVKAWHNGAFDCSTVAGSGGRPYLDHRHLTSPGY